MCRWDITDAKTMGVKQIIKDQDGDTVRVTVITDQGNIATGHYETYDTDGAKDYTVNNIISEATSKDDD